MDHQRLVGEADICLDRPVSRGEAAMPVGTGRMGSLLRTTPHAMHFQANHTDVYRFLPQLSGPVERSPCRLADQRRRRLREAAAIERAPDDPAPPKGRYVEPTLQDVRYGPHERNVLNLWKAPGDQPTPVVMLIHGGGWTRGAKAERFDRRNIDVWSGIPYLEAGVSVVSISYRLTPQHPLPAPVHDAARALQFVRHKAEQWGLDKTKVAVAGGSAGGATSLWLIYHDDLADPHSEDPVARESTKPTCAAVEAPQTCIDPILCRQWVGANVLRHRMIPYSVGMKNADELLKNYAKYKEIFREFSAYFHVDKDDPPVLLYCYGTTQSPAPDVGTAIHSPVLCWKLKQKADEVGAECDFLLRSTRSKRFYDRTLVEFVKSKLLAK
ncbi:MAG TPA: alpha/beta hydrolase [Planctomycetes bacterium]|nr:alpha/beta hydrolase [Planctomycetota bacterium]